MTNVNESMNSNAENDVTDADAGAFDTLMNPQELAKTAGSRPEQKGAAKAAAPQKKPVKKIAGQAGAAPPVVGPLMTVVMRNEFYRDGFRNMIRIALVEAVIIVGLILALIAYMNTSKPSDRFFATTADGRIMQLVSLDKPNMNTAALVSWVAQAATETMTFGFHDYQRRLQQSSRHFTRRGWESFSTALQKSGIIDSVQASQQVVTAEPRSAPILTQQGVLNGKYRWVVNLPLRVTYKGGGGAARTDNLDVSLVIERVPSLENPNGVGIAQWISTQQVR